MEELNISFEEAFDFAIRYRAFQRQEQDGAQGITDPGMVSLDNGTVQIRSAVWFYSSPPTLQLTIDQRIVGADGAVVSTARRKFEETLTNAQQDTWAQSTSSTSPLRAIVTPRPAPGGGNPTGRSSENQSSELQAAGQIVSDTSREDFGEHDAFNDEEYEAALGPAIETVLSADSADEETLGVVSRAESALSRKAASWSSNEGYDVVLVDEVGEEIKKLSLSEEQWSEFKANRASDPNALLLNNTVGEIILDGAPVGTGLQDDIPVPEAAGPISSPSAKPPKPEIGAPQEEFDTYNSLLVSLGYFPGKGTLLSGPPPSSGFEDGEGQEEPGLDTRPEDSLPGARETEDSEPVDFTDLLGSDEGGKKKPSEFEGLVGKEGVPGKSKAAIDLRGLTADELNAANNPANSGLLTRPRAEAVPGFKKAGGDWVQHGGNNQWIVMTRDRPAGLSSGYGPGLGHTQAGAIDMVVGRMSPHPRKIDKHGRDVALGPIFNYGITTEGKTVCDAARIYLSQKTNIDSNFNLAKGGMGHSTARSGIALKADGVRVIARDSGIRLITMGPTLMNSQGGISAGPLKGVELIAGNDTDNLQAMVLGSNLVQYLKAQQQIVSSLVGTVQSIILNLGALDVALATHFHPQSFPPGLPNVPSPNLAPVCVASLAKLTSMDTFSSFANNWNSVKEEFKYLNANSPNFILSKYNKVN